MLDPTVKPWTVDETAEFLSCSKDTVRRMISRGEVKAFKIGRVQRVYIDPRSVLGAARPATPEDLKD